MKSGKPLALLRSDQHQRWEIGTIASRTAREERQILDNCMGTDKEVRHDTRFVTAVLTVLPNGLGSLKQGRTWRWCNIDPCIVEESIQIFNPPEAHRKFCVDDIVD